MSGSLVYRPINNVDDAIVVLDATRRLYAGLNRAGDGWHVIQPARPDDLRVINGHVPAGDLVCTCESGAIRGRCYRTDQASAFERADITSVELAAAFA